MKKWLCLLMAAMLCVSLCGCGNQNKKEGPKDAKMNVDGEWVSANEILAKVKDDPTDFYGYVEREVEITGTVEKIETGYITIMSQSVNVYKVWLKEGWCAHMTIPDHPEMEDIQAGDIVTICSRMDMFDMANECIVVENIAISGTGSHATYSDDATIIKIDK